MAAINITNGFINKSINDTAESVLDTEDENVMDFCIIPHKDLRAFLAIADGNTYNADMQGLFIGHGCLMATDGHCMAYKRYNFIPRNAWFIVDLPIIKRAVKDKQDMTVIFDEMKVLIGEDEKPIAEPKLRYMKLAGAFRCHDEDAANHVINLQLPLLEKISTFAKRMLIEGMASFVQIQDGFFGVTWADVDDTFCLICEHRVDKDEAKEKVYTNFKGIFEAEHNPEKTTSKNA